MPNLALLNPQLMTFLCTLLFFCAVSKSLWAWLPYRIEQTCRESPRLNLAIHFQSIPSDWGLTQNKLTILGCLPLIGPFLLLNASSPSNKNKFALHLIHDVLAVLATYFVITKVPNLSGLPPTYLVAFALALLLTMSFIDIEHQLLPNALTYPFLVLGLFVSFEHQSYSSIEHAILGVLIGYFSLWAIDKAYERYTGDYAIGGGDIKLFAGIGAWFGLSMLPIVLGIACTLFLFVYCVKILISKYVNKSLEIYSSFGQYLCIAAIIVIIFYFDIILSLP